MAKRTALFGLLIALACICGYLDFLFSLPLPLPGMKLGLANLVVVTALYTLGPLTTAGISLARILLNAAMFGSPIGLIYSLAGGALSLAGMAVIYRLRQFSAIGVSVLGGILHNIGQLLAAFLLLGVSGVLYYVPALLCSGAVTGFLIGILSRLLLPPLKQLWERYG